MCCFHPLMQDFYALYIELRSKDPCATKVQKQAKDWVILFTSLKDKCDGYQPDNVTPYMHIMALHMPEVIQKHKNLYRFSCQGTDLYAQKIFTWFLHKYRHRKKR